MGDLGSIPGLGMSPGGGHGNPPNILAWKNYCGQKSLAACMGCKESDTTRKFEEASKHDEYRVSCNVVRAFLSLSLSLLFSFYHLSD